jgi:hypothetical protein
MWHPHCSLPRSCTVPFPRVRGPVACLHPMDMAKVMGHHFVIMSFQRGLCPSRPKRKFLLVFLFNKHLTAACPETLWICFLLQQCLDGTDPGTSLWNLLSSHHLQDQPTWLFVVTSVLTINHDLPDSSELFQ